VAAVALERAGIEAVVYEGADAPGDHVGLFLNTASNGLDVLRTLGIDAAGQADGFPIPRMVMWSGTGKRLGEVANGIRLQNGTVSTAIRRGLLQRVLREEAERRGVKVEFGKRLDTYRTGGDGQVVARFADGTEAEGDLLVGAHAGHPALRLRQAGVLRLPGPRLRRDLVVREPRPRRRAVPGGAGRHLRRPVEAAPAGPVRRRPRPHLGDPRGYAE
jgi:2-polyprenyl-6-methoxyphenol hydroxylase-like FAD-dependent oxidoreductase